MTVQLTIIVLIVVGTISNSAGDDIARRIEDRYNNDVEKCKDLRGREKPAYECSGIMIRGVNSNLKLELAWSLKTLNKQKAAFSVAYLRRDQVFSAFPRDYESGFIIYPHFETPGNKKVYTIFCSFPMDAHADGRHGHGCGRSHDDKTRKSDHCGKQHINSFERWKSHFKKIMKSRNSNLVTKQCGFDMTINSAAKDFALSLKANRYIQKRAKRYAFRNNELRMRAWGEKEEKRLPIEAFFYLIDSRRGKKLAEKYQKEFHDRSGGETVPIVGIRLPSAHKHFKVESYKVTKKEVAKF